MARIRTVKPEFFRHHKLFLAEKETKLPLRLAFAGLWTVADRAGRFKWEPIQIKLDCLPYDDIDFSRVLDALESRGFVMKYANGRLGLIPGFNRHQVINNKERESQIVPPSKEESDAWASRCDALSESLFLDQGERKGKEGKGREALPSVEFEAFWVQYPARKGKKAGKLEAWKQWQKVNPTGDLLNKIMVSVRSIQKEEYPKDACRWLSGQRWDDEIKSRPSQGLAL